MDAAKRVTIISVCSRHSARVVGVEAALSVVSSGKAEKMEKYVCVICGYIYDPESGDPDGGVAPGTAWEDVPEEWTCPECGVGKDQFEPA